MHIWWNVIAMFTMYSYMCTIITRFIWIKMISKYVADTFDTNMTSVTWQPLVTINCYWHFCRVPWLSVLHLLREVLFGHLLEWNSIWYQVFFERECITNLLGRWVSTPATNTTTVKTNKLRFYCGGLFYGDPATRLAHLPLVAHIFISE